MVSDYRWELCGNGREHEAGNWERWDRLNGALNGGTPILDSKFLAPLSRHFGSKSLRLAILHSAGEVLGGGLFVKSRSLDLVSFTPPQACVGGVMISPSVAEHQRSAAIAALFRPFRFAVRIIFPKQDPELSQLSEITGNKGFLSAPHAITTNIDASGDFEAYWSSRHKEVRRGIRKSLESLAQKKTECELIVLRRPEEMHAAITEHGRLESEGWKGSAGTAIHPNNSQGKCYEQILKNFAESDQARAYLLQFNKVVVASLLTIIQNGIQVVLKTTFDEGQALYSPGRLVDYFAIADAYQDSSISIIENYTASKSADRKWATGTRQIVNTEYYRHPGLPRLLHSVKRPLRRPGVK